MLFFFLIGLAIEDILLLRTEAGYFMQSGINSLGMTVTILNKGGIILPSTNTDNVYKLSLYISETNSLEQVSKKNRIILFVMVNYY